MIQHFNKNKRVIFNQKLNKSSLLKGAIFSIMLLDSFQLTSASYHIILELDGIDLRKSFSWKNFTPKPSISGLQD